MRLPAGEERVVVNHTGAAEHPSEDPNLPWRRIEAEVIPEPHTSSIHADASEYCNIDAANIVFSKSCTQLELSIAGTRIRYAVAFLERVERMRALDAN
jgi:hypothetical protein